MSEDIINLELAQGQLANIASTYGQPYLPGSTISFIDGTTQSVAPKLKEGKLWFALKTDTSQDSLIINGNSVSLGRHRAYIFLDDEKNRYAITGPVDWNDIYNKPNLIKGFNFDKTKKSLGAYGFDNEIISDIQVELPFLYADQNDTLTAYLTLGKNGKIVLNPEMQGQFIDTSERILFNCFQDEDTKNNLSIGNNVYNLNLNTTEAARWNDQDDTKSGPKITVNGTKVIAYLDDIMPKAKCDANGNIITDTYIADIELINENQLEIAREDNEKPKRIDLPFVKTAGDNITGHLYLTKADENNSTANTSQIVFGTSSNNHIALSSNKKALVINPATDSTTNQIILNLDEASVFPKGIDASDSTITATTFSGNLTGTADKATKDSEGNTFTQTYLSLGDLDVTDSHTIYFSTPTNEQKEWTENDHYPTTLIWKAGTTAGPTATIVMYKNGVEDPTSNISVEAIPSASIDTSGVVTTSSQVFSGEKTFNTAVIIGTNGDATTDAKLSVCGSINIGGNNKVNLAYNEQTESLDFSFII